MRSASKVFYLAVYALLAPISQAQHAPGSSNGPASTSNAASVCAIEPAAIVSDACVSYEALDDLNTLLRPRLKSITQETDFFSYYRLNLYNKACPFWNDEAAACGNIACAVNTLDNEDDIPPVWRTEELGKLKGRKAKHPNPREQRERNEQKPLQGSLGEDVGESCVMEYDENDSRDYCEAEEGLELGQGDYVSLIDNPERFTGYAGESAHMVWDAIYRENCFSKPSSLPSSSKSNPFRSFQAANDLRSVLVANAPSESFAPDESCIEKRVFYRIVSGMHASISTHICNEYLDQASGQWTANLTCYESRLHDHPDRISNLYFNYALVLRAVAKLTPYFEKHTFCSGDVSQDALTKTKVLDLARQAAAHPSIFDESVMFKDSETDIAGSSIDLKEDFRQRFRNVSRVMDCVGCDKCRLWGKLQTSGYGTALKVLFELEEESPKGLDLKRTELVALVNTLARISDSLSALQTFRTMKLARDGAGSASVPISISSSKESTDESKLNPHRDRGPEQANEENEDDEEERPWPDRPQYTADMSASEAFWLEFALVRDAFIYVFMSWLAIPAKVYAIARLEGYRLYRAFVGLKVPAVEYEWASLRQIRNEL